MTDWNNRHRPRRGRRQRQSDHGGPGWIPGPAAPADPSWERDAATRDWSQSGAQGGWTSGASSRLGGDEGGGRPAGPGGWDAVGGEDRAGGDEGGAADLGVRRPLEPERRRAGRSGCGAAQQFLGQLQAIIDNLATQSAPVVREIGAKAAELAAIAADRAGPLAQRAAEKTQDLGARVAERSRTFAEDMRRQQEGRGESDTDDEPDTTAPQGPTI